MSPIEAPKRYSHSKENHMTVAQTNNKINANMCEPWNFTA